MFEETRLFAAAVGLRAFGQLEGIHAKLARTLAATPIADGDLADCLEVAGDRCAEAGEGRRARAAWALARPQQLAVRRPEAAARLDAKISAGAR